MTASADSTRVQFAALSRALKAAGEGKGRDSLRGQMLAELRAIAKPILDDQRRAVQALDSNAEGTSSARRAATALSRSRNVDERKAARALGRSGLRSSIARSLRITVKDSGYSQQVGVRISTDASRLPRGESYLPRGLDSDKGWRHPVFGGPGWVRQYGTPSGWFRSTAGAHKPMAVRRVQNVLDKFAQELAARANRAA